MNELAEKIKTAAEKIKNGQSIEDVIYYEDVVEMVGALNTIMTTSFSQDLQPYIDEGLIDPLTCRYLKKHKEVPPVGSILELDENAEMFTVCGVDWVEGMNGSIVIIKGKTKWLEFI